MRVPKPPARIRVFIINFLPFIYGCNQRQDSRICVVAGYADHDYAQKPLADEVDDVAGGIPENIISQRIVAHRNFIIARMFAFFSHASLHTGRYISFWRRNK